MAYNEEHIRREGVYNNSHMPMMGGVGKCQYYIILVAAIFTRDLAVSAWVWSGVGWAGQGRLSIHFHH